MTARAIRIHRHVVALVMLVTGVIAAPGSALADELPNVKFTGGSVMQGGWLSGERTVDVEASDDVGVASIELYLDGRRVDSRTYTSPAPLQRDTLSIDTRPLRDGWSRLTVTAHDTSGQESPPAMGPGVGCFPTPCPPPPDRPSSRTIWTDNTAPAAPQEVVVDGEGAWQSENRFGVRWRNPFDDKAPIAGAGYVLCPASNAPTDSGGCVGTWRPEANLTRLSNLEVPRSGVWRLHLWLVDGAGNQDARTAVVVPRLALDSDAPELALLERQPDDPARLRVRAGDATSSVARGEVELRLQGEKAWRSLPTEPDSDGFSTFVDDGELPAGTYDIRARAVDQAGNERSTDRMPDGQPATVKLPIRIKTRLVVGKVKRVRARHARRGKRRYRKVFVVRPRARYGRTIRLHGRLTTPGANPVAGATIEVSEQTKLPGAPWQPIGSMMTSRTGRFTFKALRGPSRRLRFRYAGTKTVRSRTTEVELRVKAGTSFRVNRKRVVNGEEVVFRGRLKGEPLPASSKLVQLQVYARRRWTTFGIARANPTTGLWSHRYRFEATRGRVRYRFRARVPREASYPYDTGGSRRLRVMVRGL